MQVQKSQIGGSKHPRARDPQSQESDSIQDRVPLTPIGFGILAESCANLSGRARRKQGNGRSRDVDLVLGAKHRGRSSAGASGACDAGDDYSRPLRLRLRNVTATCAGSDRAAKVFRLRARNSRQTPKVASENIRPQHPTESGITPRSLPQYGRSIGSAFSVFQIRTRSNSSRYATAKFTSGRAMFGPPCKRLVGRFMSVDDRSA